MSAPAVLLLAVIIGALWVLAGLLVPGLHLSAFDALFVVLVAAVVSWLDTREG